MMRSLYLWLTPLSFLLVAPPSGAQAGDEVARAVAEAGRRAQARFEQVRRGALPLVESRGTPPCQVRAGRYCYWHDSDAEPPSPREPPRVTAARGALLHTLDSLAALAPEDGWLIGQRVRYRIDAGDTAAAVLLTERECRARDWWCAALAGYARHVAGNFTGAEAAFDTALQRMEAPRRCEWEDPSILLPHEVREWMSELDCVARRDAADRMWWLAAPLSAAPANDLRTEYLARRVAGELESEARMMYDTGWNWDTDEILLRYGWPVWWTRERRFTTGGVTEPRLVGHEANPTFSFIPLTDAIADRAVVPRPDDWRLTYDLATSRYAPAYVKSWSEADAQVAVFARGDSLLVLAAFEAPRDTLLRDPAARLVVSPAPRARRHASLAMPSAAGVLEVRLPAAALDGAALASIEVVDTTTRAVARHRTGFTAPHPGRLRQSDLLLHAPHDAMPAVPTLADVTPHALTSARIESDRVGVYWETYGLPADGELLDVAMTLERLDAPWLRRVASRIGLVDRITPLQIRWRESPHRTSGVAARSIVVSVDHLAPGRYRIALRVLAADGSSAESSREVIVVR